MSFDAFTIVKYLIIHPWPFVQDRDHRLGKFKKVFLTTSTMSLVWDREGILAVSQGLGIKILPNAGQEQGNNLEESMTHTHHPRLLQSPPHTFSRCGPGGASRLVASLQHPCTTLGCWY